MTVITKLKQTVSGLKSAQASLEGFALDTDNQQAKQLFQTVRDNANDYRFFKPTR